MRKRNSTFQLKRELLEQLVRTGSPVDMQVANDAERQALEIEQSGSMFNLIFELDSGRLGFMAYLRVTNRTGKMIQVVDAYLRGEMFDGFFQWLIPLEMESTRGASKTKFSLYRFPGRGAPEIPFDQSLNHKLLDSGFLRSKRSYEGWLLGVGGLMPTYLMDRQWQEVPLVIVVADHSEFTATLRLGTERLAVRRKSEQRSSLEQVEPIEGGVSPRNVRTSTSLASFTIHEPDEDNSNPASD
jgi:hypothetical protein